MSLKVRVGASSVGMLSSCSLFQYTLPGHSELLYQLMSVFNSRRPACCSAHQSYRSSQGVPCQLLGLHGEAEQVSAYRQVQQGDVLAAVARAHACLGHPRHLPHLYNVLPCRRARCGRARRRPACARVLGVASRQDI